MDSSIIPKGLVVDDGKIIVLESLGNRMQIFDRDHHSSPKSPSLPIRIRNSSRCHHCGRDGRVLISGQVLSV